MALVNNNWRHYGGIVEVPHAISIGGSDVSLDGLQEEKAKLENISLQPKHRTSSSNDQQQNASSTNCRLNKFVRRLHEMLSAERNGDIVEWRRGLLVLHSIDRFSTEVLPKYFNTHNFKTFRRQLNYYGFLHVRSFSGSGSTTTALWVNQELANHGSDCISSVLKLKRVDPPEKSKTPEGRRVRKNEAASSVEVGGLGELIASYCSDVPSSFSLKASGCPVPKLVHFQHQPSTPTIPKMACFDHAASPVTPPKTRNDSFDSFSSQEESIDPVVDHAAGLLLSLSHGRA